MIDLLSSASALQLTVLLIFIPVLIAGAIEFVLFKTLATYVPDERKYIQILLRKSRVPILTTITLLGATVLSSIPEITATVYFTEAQIDRFIGNPALSIIVIIWAFYTNSFINTIVDEVNTTSDNRVGKTDDASPILSNLVSIGIILGAIAVLLKLWDYDITPLLGAAGILGIAVGFAAKETLSNFLGGIALYVDDTYTIGDYLKLDSGVSGSVIKIGIRSTTLLTKDNIQVNVPNSILNNSKVVNQSAPRKDIRVRLPISVSYGTDIEQLEAILLEIANENQHVIKNPTPSVSFIEFGEFSINYEVRVWIESPLQINRVRHSINSEMYKRLQEEGIEIPFPQQEITVKNENLEFE